MIANLGAETAFGLARAAVAGVLDAGRCLRRPRHGRSQPLPRLGRRRAGGHAGGSRADRALSGALGNAGRRLARLAARPLRRAAPPAPVRAAVGVLRRRGRPGRRALAAPGTPAADRGGDRRTVRRGRGRAARCLDGRPPGRTQAQGCLARSGRHARFGRTRGGRLPLEDDLHRRRYHSAGCGARDVSTCRPGSPRRPRSRHAGAAHLSRPAPAVRAPDPRRFSRPPGDPVASLLAQHLEHGGDGPPSRGPRHPRVRAQDAARRVGPDPALPVFPGPGQGPAGLALGRALGRPAPHQLPAPGEAALADPERPRAQRRRRELVGDLALRRRERRAGQRSFLLRSGRCGSALGRLRAPRAAGAGAARAAGQARGHARGDPAPARRPRRGTAGLGTAPVATAAGRSGQPPGRGSHALERAPAPAPAAPFRSRRRLPARCRCGEPPRGRCVGPPRRARPGFGRPLCGRAAGGLHAGGCSTRGDPGGRGTRRQHRGLQRSRVPLRAERALQPPANLAGRSAHPAGPRVRGRPLPGPRPRARPGTDPAGSARRTGLPRDGRPAGFAGALAGLAARRRGVHRELRCALAGASTAPRVLEGEVEEGLRALGYVN